MFRFLLLAWICFHITGVICRNTSSENFMNDGESQSRFSYQVSLRFKHSGNHQCCGGIISTKFILTAAHCVCRTIPFYRFVAVVGTSKLSTGGTVYNLDQAICHEGFNFRYLKNDIALLKTIQSIIFTPTVQPILLLQSEIPPGSQILITGWDLGRYPGILRDDLRFSLLQTTTMEECGLYYPVISDKQICGFARRGHGACLGDSGSPVVYQGFLAGIVSYGIFCIEDYPEVYTKISAYNKWIDVYQFKESN